MSIRINLLSVPRARSGGITRTCRGKFRRIMYDVPLTMRSSLAFLAIVPGSQSFSIPTTNVTNMAGSDSGFSWTPSSQIGSELVFVGGDVGQVGGLAVAQNVSNTVIQSANSNCSGGTAPISASSTSVSATSQVPTGSNTAFASSHATSSVDARGRGNDG